MPETTIAADVLGNRAVEALEAAGHRLSPEGAGHDGFDVLLDPSAAGDHVLIVPSFQGDLFGIATGKVNHQETERWHATLTAAGFAVRAHQQDGLTAFLIVGVDADGADRGAAHVRAHITAHLARKKR